MKIKIVVQVEDHIEIEVDDIYKILSEDSNPKLSDDLYRKIKDYVDIKYPHNHWELDYIVVAEQSNKEILV